MAHTIAMATIYAYLALWFAGAQPESTGFTVNKLTAQQITANTKMGQLRVAIDPFGKLVAGIGFEPMTFGL